MKSFFRLLLLLVTATALFPSCKNASPKQTKFIPKDAAFVAMLNTSSVKSKLVKSQATIENLLKSISHNSDTALDKGKKEWEDLKNSGVDLDENIYASVVQKDGGMRMGQMPMASSSVVSVVAGLEDASKFEAYLKKKDATAQIKKEKEFSYSSNENNMVAWGKDVIIFMTYNSAPSMPELDSIAPAFEVKPTQLPEPFDIKAEMISYFNLKEDESIASIAQFRELATGKADGSLWMNASSTASQVPFPLPKLNELLENSYTAATINFEDGRVVMNSKTYTSDAMGDLLEKYSGSTVDLDLVKNYPSDNINAFFVSSFNPEFFTGLVKFLEVGSFVDGFIKKSIGPDYGLQDILKAIKGDVAVVVSDMNVRGADSATMVKEVKQANTNQSFNKAKVLVNVSVADKVQFNRLMDKLVEQKMMVKANNEYKLAPELAGAGFKVSLDDKSFLIASDSSIITQYKSGTAKSNIDAAILDGFKGKSAAGFVDLEKILSTIVPNASDAESVASAKATFKNIKAYAENFKGKTIEGTMEINMKDEKENSLTSLLKFFAASAKTIERNSTIKKEVLDSSRLKAEE